MKMDMQAELAKVLAERQEQLETFVKSGQPPWSTSYCIWGPRGGSLRPRRVPGVEERARNAVRLCAAYSAACGKPFDSWHVLGAMLFNDCHYPDRMISRMIRQILGR